MQQSIKIKRHSDLSLKTICLTLSVLLLFLSVITINLFGEHRSLYTIPRYVTLAFMAISVVALISGAKVQLSTPIVLVLLNVYWFVFATLWAPSQAVAMNRLTTIIQTLIMGILVYEIALNTDSYETYFKALFYSGLALLVYSLSVYGFEGIIEQMQGGSRLGGEIGNENTFGLVFSYACVCGFYFAFFKNKWLYLLGSAVFVFFALSSGSKKALFTIAIGIFFILVFKYGLRRIYKVMIIGAICTIALLYLLSLPIFGTTAARLTAFVSGTSHSDGVRASMRHDAIEMFLQKPFFGNGTDAFRTLSRYGVYSHNNFTEILANYGLVGFVLYYSSFAYVALGCIRGMRRKSQTSIMMLILLLVRLIMDYGMVSYYGKSVWIFLGMGFALAIREREIIKRGALNDRQID